MKFNIDVQRLNPFNIWYISFSIRRRHGYSTTYFISTARRHSLDRVFILPTLTSGRLSSIVPKSGPSFFVSILWLKWEVTLMGRETSWER